MYYIVDSSFVVGAGPNSYLVIYRKKQKTYRALPYICAKKIDKLTNHDRAYV